MFRNFSKLQEVEVKNQELLSEIDGLKKETEELRLRRGWEKSQNEASRRSVSGVQGSLSPES